MKRRDVRNVGSSVMAGRVLGLGLLLAAMGVPAICAEERTDWIRDGIEDWRASMAEIAFYGKVLDQHGHPVAKAEVTALAPVPAGSGADDARTVSVLTDQAGGFEISRQALGLSEFKGGLLSIEGIHRRGYQYFGVSRGTTSFAFGRNMIDRFRARKGDPILFRMRKEESNPTFLLRSEDLRFRFGAADSGKSRGYDFVERVLTRTGDQPIPAAETPVCDLRVTATARTNGASWSVILSAGGSEGGIVASDQFYDEAPAAGYRAQYTFDAGGRRPIQAKYVYVKSREPAIYTRFEIDDVRATEKLFQLKGEAVTNPYGDRNLEEATDLPYAVVQKRLGEAQAAFRENRRPPKPDRAILIREANTGIAE